MLLDGSLPTELRLAGTPVEPPWWTDRVLLTGPGCRILRSIHEAHLAAGADVLTANTFHCARETLLGLGLDPSAGPAWMVHAAVGVARAAMGTRSGVLIAGSLGPLGGPPRTDEELRAEHGWLATELTRARVDVVLVESMTSAREALIALDAVLAADSVPWVGFRCAEGARMPSGDSIAAAALATAERGADLVSVHCGTVNQVEAALRAVRAAGYTGRLGACPDVPEKPTGDLAEHWRRWRADFGVDLVGGCCGMTTAHLRQAGNLAGQGIGGTPALPIQRA